MRRTVFPGFESLLRRCRRTGVGTSVRTGAHRSERGQRNSGVRGHAPCRLRKAASQSHNGWRCYAGVAPRRRIPSGRSIALRNDTSGFQRRNCFTPTPQPDARTRNSEDCARSPRRSRAVACGCPSRLGRSSSRPPLLHARPLRASDWAS